MENKCNHKELTKINHWWFNFKCRDCNKRFKWIPKGWYYINELK